MVTYNQRAQSRTCRSTWRCRSSSNPVDIRTLPAEPEKQLNTKHRLPSASDSRRRCVLPTGRGHHNECWLCKQPLRQRITCDKAMLQHLSLARCLWLNPHGRRIVLPKIVLSNKSGVFVVSDTRKHGMHIGRPETPLSISILRRDLARRAISRWSSEKRR